MSTLAWTAQFVRISPRAFSDVAKDVRVFAQLLVGGRGVLVVDRLGAESRRVMLEVQDSSRELDLLRACLVLVEPELCPPALAQRAREVQGGVAVLAPDEIEELVSISRELRVAIHVTCYEGRPHFEAAELGGWRVSVASATL